MKDNILCDPYFWENPMILLNTGLFYSIITVCKSEHINHIINVAVVFGLIGYGLSHYMKKTAPMILAAVVAVFLTTPSLFALSSIRSAPIEGFQEIPSVDIIGKNGAGIASAKPRLTTPTARNPFMNVLIDELKYNPSRPPAASIMDPNIRVTLDDFFKTEFARDPTDVFCRNQSQRQFITMPSTSIPNDVDSYRNWLYKIPGKTCKEGGREACLPGTDGGALPWLNVDS